METEMIAEARDTVRKQRATNFQMSETAHIVVF